MSDNFFEIIQDVKLDEIIEIFEKFIVKESKTDNQSYIIFINFQYPTYFINKFGSKAITDKIYEFILINTKRGIINFNDFKLNFLELIIFYEKYNNYSCKAAQIFDKVTGLIFPIINRFMLHKIVDDKFYFELYYLEENKCKSKKIIEKIEEESEEIEVETGILYVNGYKVYDVNLKMINLMAKV